MRRIPIAVLTSASVLCWIANNALAQFPATISPPAPLNTNADTDTGSDGSPKLAADGLGHWVAVWSSNDSLGGSIGTDGDVLLARSIDNGATWTAPAPLNGNAGSDTGADTEPEVATDGHGTWVAVWQSNENLGGVIGTDFNILFARSTNNGETWTPPAPLNNAGSDGNILDFSPRIATDGRGHWVAAWWTLEPGPGSPPNLILVSHSADNGVTWSSPAPVSIDPTSNMRDGSYPGIATDRNGNWIVVWGSYDPTGGSLGMDFDILVARSTDDGVTWTSPAPLNTNAAADTESDSGPQIAMGGQGNAVVVWAATEDHGAMPTDFFILSASSSDGGATWTDPIRLNNNSAGDFSAEDEIPSITTDGRGNWVVGWDGNNKPDGTLGTDFEVWVTYSSDNGASWTSPASLKTTAATDTVDDFFAQVASDGRGNWVGVWQIEPFGSDYDVLAARFALPDCNNNGIGDGQDIADGSSADCDGNGVPDECQADSDGDGAIDICDNCLSVANSDQADSDGDGIGDACSAAPTSACGTCGAGMATMMPLAMLAFISARKRKRS